MVRLAGEPGDVADDHEAAALHHQKNLLVIAVPMKANAAVRPHDVQIHVVNGHEAFPARLAGFLPKRVQHPRLDLPAEFRAAGVAAIVR